MTSKIKNAVTKAIHNLFGDDYAVYTAYTEQGFSEPCFIVEMFRLTYSRQIHFWTMKRRR